MNQQNYPRLFEMLACGCPIAPQDRERVVAEVAERAAAELAAGSDAGCPDAKLLRCICTAMGEYLQSCRASAVFRQRLRENMQGWMRSMCTEYGAEEPSFDAWPEPIRPHQGSELVKLLHGQPGMTKREVARALGVSAKTVQSGLRRLDPTLCEEGEAAAAEPFRLGGHEMLVRIDAEVIPGSRGERLYHTENTLHPLVMQLNVMQVAAVLKGLQLCYDGGDAGETSLQTAMDVWCQLTPYCQERIWKHFCRKDPDLEEFLRMVQEELDSGRVPRFQSEREMLQENAATDELLLHALKTRCRCAVVIRQNGEEKEYGENRISENGKGGFQVLSEDGEPLASFRRGELVGISLCS